MRTENANKERLLSREAAADITKHRVLKDVGANKVQHVADAEDVPSCISRYDAEAGRAASCQYPPSDTIVEAGGIIPDNTEVIAMGDGTGRVITAVGAAAGSYKVGKTINGSSSSGAGQMVTIKQYVEPIVVV